MTIFSKTIRAAELPDSWQRELGLDSGQLVKVEIEEIAERRSQAEIDALRSELRSIVPIDVEGDVTDFIRAERDAIDGRNGST